jgi:glucose/arabinose dehydrogenase
VTLDAAGSPRGRRELLRVEDPYPNHNGGHLALGPDGYLYIGLGDGGSGGDPHGHGQDTDTLLGSILRIDPTAPPADGEYGIPADNPFAASGGEPEIWLYGVRNPWRFSFDRATGDLWIGDVGQGEVEEIDRLPATNGRDAGRGANLGWNLMEGSEPFEGENPAGGVLPIYEYTHDDGCSVTGGYVYRGRAIPALTGAYLFADYCEPDLRAVRVAGDEVVEERSWDLSLEAIQSFGEDADGELYVLLASGPLLRLTAG